MLKFIVTIEGFGTQTLLGEAETFEETVIKTMTYVCGKALKGGRVTSCAEDTLRAHGPKGVWTGRVLSLRFMEEPTFINMLEIIPLINPDPKYIMNIDTEVMQEFEKAMNRSVNKSCGYKLVDTTDTKYIEYKQVNRSRKG